MLGGINSALSIQGAKLIGGHTLESRAKIEEPFSLGIETSLTVNGIIDDKKHFWSKGGMKKGDQILISRPLGTGVVFSAFNNGYVESQILDSVLNEMNKSQHHIVNQIKQLENNYSDINIVNACTDITGFGLLGHLSEMLESTNFMQANMSLKPVKIILELDSIPIYEGIIELINKGFESTLAPYNEIFLRNIDGSKDLRVELICNHFEFASSAYFSMLKVLVDPQTCGPLVISCSPLYSEKLIEKGPWKRIGFVA